MDTFANTEDEQNLANIKSDSLTMRLYTTDKETFMKKSTEAGFSSASQCLYFFIINFNEGKISPESFLDVDISKFFAKVNSIKHLNNTIRSLTDEISNTLSSIRDSTFENWLELNEHIQDKNEKPQKPINNGFSRTNYRKKREIQNKRFVDSFKNKCALCGETKQHALVFHHKDPKEKEFTISQSYRFGKEKLTQEIEKCVVLCSNCHLEIHHYERNPETPPQELIEKYKELGLLRSDNN